MAAAMHPTEVWSKTQFDKENRLAPGQLELLNSLPGWGNLGTVRARSPNASGCLARTNWHPRRTPRLALELPLTTTIPPREPQAIPLDETPDASPTNSQDAPEAKAIVRPSQGDFLKRQKGPMLEDSGSDSEDDDDDVDVKADLQTRGLANIATATPPLATEDDDDAKGAERVFSPRRTRSKPGDAAANVVKKTKSPARKPRPEPVVEDIAPTQLAPDTQQDILPTQSPPPGRGAAGARDALAAAGGVFSPRQTRSRAAARGGKPKPAAPVQKKEPGLVGRMLRSISGAANAVMGAAGTPTAKAAKNDDAEEGDRGADDENAAEVRFPGFGTEQRVRFRDETAQPGWDELGALAVLSREAIAGAELGADTAVQDGGAALNDVVAAATKFGGAGVGSPLRRAASLFGAQGADEAEHDLTREARERVEAARAGATTPRRSKAGPGKTSPGATTPARIGPPTGGGRARGAAALVMEDDDAAARTPKAAVPGPPAFNPVIRGWLSADPRFKGAGKKRLWSDVKTDAATTGGKKTKGPRGRAALVDEDDAYVNRGGGDAPREGPATTGGVRRDEAIRARLSPVVHRAVMEIERGAAEAAAAAKTASPAKRAPLRASTLAALAGPGGGTMPPPRERAGAKGRSAPRRSLMSWIGLEGSQ